MTCLRIAVKQEYFDQIKSGEKTEEYRLCTPYWDKRLPDRPKYEYIIITAGYPRCGDSERTMNFPYRGWKKKTITHKHFGTDPVEVYAIKLEDRI